MKKIILFCIFIIGINVQLFAVKPLEKILQQEARRNLEKMSQAEIPAYYISYRVVEETNVDLNSVFGEISGEGNRKKRIIQVIVRVGSPKLDNTHEIKDGMDGGGGYNEERSFCEIPLTDDEKSISLILWNKTDKIYKLAVQRFEKVKANVAVKVEAEDKTSDFSSEKPEQYSEPAISEKSLAYDVNDMKSRLNKYSAVFRDNKDITSGNVYFNLIVTRMFFADTDGALITENKMQARVSLSAQTVADDGMVLPMFKSYFAHSVKSLPDDKEMMQGAQDVSNMLTALRKAPVADTYSGPAILSPDASGVFFHEFFGHRVEGARMKMENDAQTFKKKIGEKVLANGISIYFDPTIKFYKKLPLSGNYVFDDEGIRAKKVNVVTDGILTDFLISRTPIEGHLLSNGHGRGMIYYQPVTRQSNMIIETSKPLTSKELREKMMADLKAQNKPYGYMFCNVSGGFTNVSRIEANAFNVTPLVVYRIYADGRPDELVRGVNMIGTPLSIFSLIDGCGDDHKVFNGYCGAESGSVPVSCVAPSIYVKNVETQKQAKSQNLPPIISRP